jgi:hypothetical protein
MKYAIQAVRIEPNHRHFFRPGPAVKVWKILVETNRGLFVAWWKQKEAPREAEVRRYFRASGRKEWCCL